MSCEHRCWWAFSMIEAAMLCVRPQILRRQASPCRHARSMIPLSDDQLRAFAERGYVVIGDVVQRELISAAMLYVDTLIEQKPPPPDHRGYHFYWQNALAPLNPLRSLLTDSPAWSIAEFLINPLKLALPQQAQVSLNIPPWRHRPGGPHLDGLTPPEPSGRPGTFTMLAGVFLTDQRSSDMGNLWVWPGSHRVTATYLRRHGPDGSAWNCTSAIRTRPT